MDPDSSSSIPLSSLPPPPSPSASFSSSLNPQPSVPPCLLESSASKPMRTMRVSQLDAAELDEALVSMLASKLTDSLDVFGPETKMRYQPELTLALQVLIYRMGIYASLASPGATLQRLRFQPTKWNVMGSSSRQLRHISPNVPPYPRISVRNVLLLHFFLTPQIWPKYLLTRLRNYALSRSWPDLPRRSWRRRLWHALERLEDLMKLGELIGLVWFLYDARYPTLLLRLLGLRLVPTASTLARMVSYEFMSRQLVWSTVGQALPHLLPLLVPLVEPLRRVGGEWREGLERLRAPLPDYSGVIQKNGDSHHGSVTSSITAATSSSLSPNHIPASSTPSARNVGRPLIGPYAHLPISTCPICHSKTSASTSSNATMIPQLPFLPPLPSRPLAPPSPPPPSPPSSTPSVSASILPSTEPTLSSHPSDLSDSRSTIVEPPSSTSPSLPESDLTPHRDPTPFPHRTTTTTITTITNNNNNNNKEEEAEGDEGDPETQTQTPVRASCWARCEYCYYCLGETLLRTQREQKARSTIVTKARGEERKKEHEHEEEEEEGEVAWGCLRCGGDVWGFEMLGK